MEGFPLFAKKCDIDLDDCGICVIQAGGDSVLQLIQLAEKFGIPCIGIRDSDGDKQYKGKVEKVSTAAVDSKYSKTKEKVIQVEVSIDEENDLRPGFIADVEISGQAKTAVPVVNSFSVIEEDGEYFVYINDGGRARKQKVNVGARTVNSYEILDLPVGTQVIVNPFKVRNGEK